jgi:hypothetical protein
MWSKSDRVSDPGPYCFGDKLREMGDKPAGGLSRAASVHKDAAITTPAEMESDDVASEAEKSCTQRRVLHKDMPRRSTLGDSWRRACNIESSFTTLIS